jgi:hypothetical protein
MSVTLPLETMSVAEKFEVLDLIWEDLSRTPDSIPSPDWHRVEILKRFEGLANGVHKYSDWEDAKKRLRDSML